ncbi:MAG: phosphatase PAP2 family protein [Thermoanaerobaculia bacterium]|nr:phosphatase PAP2 family protein [Thermoanaerobaculia bacterium]
MSFAGIRSFLRARLTREGTVGLYLTVGFVVCAAAVVLFGTLARFVFHAEGSDLDRLVTVAIRKFHAPGQDRVLRAITALGDVWVLAPAMALVTWLLVRKAHRVSAVLFAGSVVGGFLLNVLLKWTFERARPDLWPPLVTEHTFAFPSGHAAMSTVFYGGAAAVVFHLSRRPNVRLASFLAAAAIITAVAISRVYLGAHWLTDVLAGILVGVFWIAVCATGTEYFARRRALRAGPAPTL